MVKWTGQRLESLGATVEYADVGTQEVGTEGQTIPLPPVILATLGRLVSGEMIIYTVVQSTLGIETTLRQRGRGF